MDTRFWGPSGWQLFHAITFTKGNTDSKKKFFTAMKDVLPCKYCRESTNQFMKELPIPNNIAFWLYELHNKVNEKLADQHEKDKTVEKPAPSPSFEEVVTKYHKILKSKEGILGRDFLFSVAYNYDPEIHRAANEKFWDELLILYPFYQQRKLMFKPDLSSSKTYLKDVHSMFAKMGESDSLKSVTQQLAYYKSGCTKKTYKGKTCRKLQSGGYTKNRDRKKTHRIAHARLLR
jgi:hypothetical protein